MEKFVLNKDQSFGEIEVSPEFEPNIKVKLRQDINPDSWNRLKALAGSGKKEDQETFARELYTVMIVDWNIYIDENTKLEIDLDAMESKLSRRLSKWIGEKVLELFFELVGKSETEPSKPV